MKDNCMPGFRLMMTFSIEPFHRPLITNGFVAILAKMARMTFGNTNMPKFCMQSLVRVIASVDQVGMYQYSLSSGRKPLPSY